MRRLIEDEGLAELAIVQDADRMDAIGAVGVARCFTFLGAKGEGSEGGWELGGAIAHFEDKLEGLGALMKTVSGRRMAECRVERVRVFRGWFGEEVGLDS